MSKIKKQNQLGMNPSTASAKLIKDILFSFVKKDGIMCHQCGEEMQRSNFSIEHKIPWLDSKDPIGLYFDLNNISFSHLTCNINARRTSKENMKIHPSISSYKQGCRCDECKEIKKIENSKRKF